MHGTVNIRNKIFLSFNAVTIPVVSRWSSSRENRTVFNELGLNDQVFSTMKTVFYGFLFQVFFWQCKFLWNVLHILRKITFAFEQV